MILFNLPINVKEKKCPWMLCDKRIILLLEWILLKLVQTMRACVIFSYRHLEYNPAPF